MLSRFEIEFDCSKDLRNWNMGSLFHGVLMERLPGEYAEKMHADKLRPYSQYINSTDHGVVWTVNCLNDECAEEFEKVLMHGEDEIELKNKDQKLMIMSKQMSCLSYKTLIDKTYFGEVPKYIDLVCKTPVSFKNEGRYMIFPNVEAIYRNLMRRFDEFSDECGMYDEDTIQSLVDKTYISSYDLKSLSYHIESVKIPSFFGRMTLRNNGPEQLAGLTYLLLRFGEYAGLGIKTALGMGAVKTEEVRSFAKR